MVKEDPLKVTEEYQRRILPITEKYLAGKKVLDVGCGNGLPALVIGNHCDIFLTDVEDIRDERAKGFEFRKGEIGKLPYPDNSFDTLYVQFVLHHLNSGCNLDQILKELSRVTRQYLIIVEETHSEETDMEKALEYDNLMNEVLHPGSNMPVVRYFTHDELIDHFEESPFNVAEEHLIDSGADFNGNLETRVYILEAPST